MGATSASYTTPAITTARTYRAIITCTASAQSATSAPVTVSPLNAGPPYTENFESITAQGIVPPCMTATPFGPFTGAYTATNTWAASNIFASNIVNRTPGGSKFGYFYYASSSSAFITPAMNLQSGKTYQFSFWYATSTAFGTNSLNLSVRFGTTNTITGLTSTAGTVTPVPSPNTAYKKYTVNFTVPSNNTYYIGIVANIAGIFNGIQHIAIDDLNLIELPPCAGTPSAGAVFASNVNPCPGDIITLGDTTLSVQSGTTIRWQKAVSGGTGFQDITVTPTNGANTADLISEPIIDTVRYRLWIRCDNTTPATTDTSLPIQINPRYPVLPYLEDFESITANGQFPNCMTGVQAPTATTTWTSNQSNNRINHTTGGSKFATFNSPFNQFISGVITPGFRLKAGVTYEISAWYIVGGTPGTNWTTFEFRRGFAPTTAAMSTLIRRAPNAPLTNTTWRYLSETFTVPADSTYYFGVLSQHGTNGSFLSVDDIGIVKLDSCTGTPNAGGAPVAFSPVVCPGDVTDITPDTSAATTYRSNIGYQWQQRTRTTPWANATGGQNDTLRRYTTGPINDTTWYRVAMTCRNTPAPNNTDTSDSVLVAPSFPTLPYLETFEGITATNTLPPCMSASDLGGGVLSYLTAQGGTGRTNRTTGGAKFVSFSGNYNTTDALYTPGFSLKADSTYEFSFWYQAGTSTSTVPANFADLNIRVGTSPSYTTMSVLGSVRPLPVSTSTYTRYTATFRPTASGIYYFGIAATRTTVNNTFISIDDIGVTRLPECTGLPTGGNAVILPGAVSSLDVCPGSVNQLNLDGSASNTGNLSLQWQESTNNGVTWNNVTGGFGASSRYYQTVRILDTVQYRVQLTCNTTPATVAYSSVAELRPTFPAFPYVETFESITAADQLPGCMSATGLGTNLRTYIANQTSGNRTNHTAGGSKFATFTAVSAGTKGLYTPGMYLRAGRTYYFSFWYQTGNSGTGAPANVTSLSAWYGTEPTVAAMTNPIGSVQSSPVANTTYQQFQETFIPAADGVYYLGIQATTTGAATAYVTIDDIGLDILSNCTGKPDAGIIAAVTPCANAAFTLRTTGGTSRFAAAGLTFQWQDSTAGGWNPASGPTANSTEYTTSIPSARPFRLIVTCTPSGQSDTSDSYLVEMAPFYNCYCIPTYAIGASTSGITNVKLRNLNHTSLVSAPWYSDYTGQQPSPLPVPQLTMMVTDTLSVTVGSNGTNYTGVWIDFDHNSVFDAGEFFTNGVTTAANGKAEVLITPPATALFGQTRMRIRSGDRAVVSNGMACGPTGSAYGEAEDYYVTIQYPPCTGPVNAGTAVASETATCVGYSVDLSDTTHEQRMSGISWEWQSSRDGGLSWDPVAGSAGKDTLNNVLITGPVSYRVRMFCANTGDSSYSVPANVILRAPYACYCVSQSTGTSNDYSDIGAVQISTMINSTGGPHILNPVSVRRHSFYTDIPNIVLNADGTYRLSVYHIQRNGVHENARVSVFVDYNNDLAYNAAATPNSERVFTMMTSGGNYYLDTVLRVPNAVIPNAPTGLRVILNSDPDPNAPANLGCGEYMSGETEDYVVRFVRNPSSIGGVGGNGGGVSLYPNPTTGRFTVSVDGGTGVLGTIGIAVRTLTGQTLLSSEHRADGVRKYTTDLDLGSAARGIYFVEITTGAGKTVKRINLR
jgi:hypothetical protein